MDPKKLSIRLSAKGKKEERQEKRTAVWPR